MLLRGLWLLPRKLKYLRNVNESQLPHNGLFSLGANFPDSEIHDRNNRIPYARERHFAEFTRVITESVVFR